MTSIRREEEGVDNDLRDWTQKPHEDKQKHLNSCETQRSICIQTHHPRITFFDERFRYPIFPSPLYTGSMKSTVAPMVSSSETSCFSVML